MRVLNLYAGIGGNRKLWQGCQVTAVEYNPQIANVYRALYPQDTLIVDDAHEYLRAHYDEFDFIWASPPCQSHSSMRQNLAVRFRGTTPEYPDMKLYQEIIFLQANARGLWVIENVMPYYEPLIAPTATLQRHLFWANFPIPKKEFPKDTLRSAQIDDLQAHTGIDLSAYALPNKRQILRNCVFPALGAHIMDCAKARTSAEHQKQLGLLFV